MLNNIESIESLCDTLRIKLAEILTESNRFEIDLFSLYDFLSSLEKENSDVFSDLSWKSITVQGIDNGLCLVRSHFSWLFFDSFLFFYGGKSPDKPSETCLGKFDLNNMTIEKKNYFQGPGTRKNCSIALHSETIYLFGGFRREYLNDFWKFDLGLDKWTEFKILGIPARSGSLLCVFQEYLFIYGGGNKSQIFKDFYLIDTSTLNKIPSFQFEAYESFEYSKTLMASCKAGENFYVFGGKISEKLCTGSFDLFTFDENNTCVCVERLSQLPPARFSGSLCVVKEGLLALTGGDSTEKQLNDLWVYNIEGDNWTEIETVNSYYPRKGNFSVCYRDSLLVFGGSCKGRFADSLIWTLPVAGAHSDKDLFLAKNLSSIKIEKVLSLYYFSQSGCRVRIEQSLYDIDQNKLYHLLNIDPQEIRRTKELFQDYFAVLIYIFRLWPSFRISVFIKGQISVFRDKVCKIIPKTFINKLASKNKKSIDKDYQTRQAILNNWKRSPATNLNILKITIKSKISQENFTNFILNNSNSLYPFFVLSDHVLIISKHNENYSVILLTKQGTSFCYFFCVLDKSLKVLFPDKHLSHACLSNIINRSHLKSSKDILETTSIDIFLYTNYITKSENGDLIDTNQKTLFSLLVYSNDLKTTINKSPCTERVINKSLLSTFCSFKLYKSEEPSFSVLIYHASKLIYWKHRDISTPYSYIIEITDPSFISPYTGMLNLCKSNEILRLLT